MATTTPQHAHLTPQFCFSTSALKEFLRTSRSAVDDTISQSLNTLSTPSRTPFDPSSTSRRSRPAPHRLVCAPFVHSVLFPSWQARTDVLEYCAAVAAAAAADDPPPPPPPQEGAVDERLDPYSGRCFPVETRAQALAAVVRNECVVEEIVRERSWRVVGERCDGGGGGAWREAWGAWRDAGGR